MRLPGSVHPTPLVNTEEAFSSSCFMRIERTNLTLAYATSILFQGRTIPGCTPSTFYAMNINMNMNISTDININMPRHATPGPAPLLPS